MTMNGNKQLVDEWILQILFGLKFCICTRITRRKYRYAFTIYITTYKTKNEQEIWFLFSPRCFSHYEDGLCNQWLVITQFFYTCTNKSWVYAPLTYIFLSSTKYETRAVFVHHYYKSTKQRPQETMKKLTIHKNWHHNLSVSSINAILKFS